ncbi:MAG: hypothetical protein NVSMB52_00850 [Chloroflexota bacterium]
MKVRDIMMPPSGVTTDTRVTDAARRVLSEGLSGLPVLGESGEVLGLVTQRDLVAKHARIHAPTYIGILGGIIPLNTHRTDEDLRRVFSVTVGDLMTTDPVMIGPDMEVDDAAGEMVDEDADPLLVVEDGRLVGTVSHSDIIRLLILEESNEQETRSTE